MYYQHEDSERNRLAEAWNKMALNEEPIGQVSHKLNIKIVIDKTTHAGDRQDRHVTGDEKGGSRITGQAIDDSQIRSVAHKGTRKMIDQMILDRIDLNEPVHIKDTKTDMNVIGVMKQQNGELIFKVITVMVKPNFKAKQGTVTVEV